MKTEYEKAEERVNKWKSCKTIEDVLIEVNLTNNISSLTLFKNIIFKECGFNDLEKKQITKLIYDHANLTGAKQMLQL